MADDVDALALILHDRLHRGSWRSWPDLETDERGEYLAAAEAVKAALPVLGYAPVGAVEHEWAVRVDGGPMDGQILPQGAEVIARDTVRRIVSGTGVLLRRPIARGPWEEVDAVQRGDIR